VLVDGTDAKTRTVIRNSIQGITAFFLVREGARSTNPPPWRALDAACGQTGRKEFAFTFVPGVYAVVLGSFTLCWP